MHDDQYLMIQGIRIDSSLLKRGAIARCELVECLAACCTGGVWLEPEEMPRILEWAETIKRHIPPERHDESTWFSAGEPDENMPRGHEVGTTTVDDPMRPGQTCCVFLRSDRKCALQVVSEERHLGWPGLKPFFCAIYPLYFEDNMLSMDQDTPLDFEGGGCQRVAPEIRPMYCIYREEAILILGEDGYQELCKRAEEK